MHTVTLYLKKNFSIDLPIPPFSPGIVLVQGKNGCGKSTLLRLLASKFDFPLNQFIPEHCLNFLVESSLFIEESTVSASETLFKNLNYVNSFLDMDINKQNAFISLLGLNHILNQKFRNCSTGEKKKFLSILNLSQKGKKIYYLDEPFESIDKISAMNLLTILSDEFKGDKTLYMASHRQEILGSLKCFNFNFPD